MLNFVSKKSIIILKIRYSILFSFLAFLSGFMGIFSIYFSIFLCIFLILTYIFIVIYYCNESYKNKSYYISEKLITINYGVFFHKSISVNLNKLQYIELVQSPLQRLFSVCSLIFHTSGSKTTLSNIELSVGIKIKCKLIRRATNEL